MIIKIIIKIMIFKIQDEKNEKNVLKGKLIMF